MPDGFLLIDKPAGPTSHDVVAGVRRTLRERRVGHAGTLDPFATGVLVLLLGRATRLSRYATGLPKTYEGTLRLGESTDTEDLTGRIVASDPSWTRVTDGGLRDAFASLLGHQRQRPPAYSAKKVRGQPAHRRVRRGEAVEIEPQDIWVHALTLIDRTECDVSFRVEVSSGTYVRSLARDIGERLGCGAHLRTLRRTAVGPLPVAEAISPGAAGPDAIRPARDLLAHLPAVMVGPEDRDLVCHGRTIASPIAVTGPVALYEGEELLAVAEATGEILQPRVVLVS